MRDRVCRTELAFFTDYFLPLAAKCLDRSKACLAAGDQIASKAYEVLTYQVWSLLPGFLSGPTDLTASFKGIARILGTQLNQRKELRLDILTGLRNVIRTNLDNPVMNVIVRNNSINFVSSVITECSLCVQTCLENLG